MQRITQRALKPAAIHAVIGLQVPDGRFYGTAPLEPVLLLLAQSLELAPVNDLLVRVVAIHPAKAQVDHHVFDLGGNVLCQDADLLEDVAQNASVDTATALLTPNS